MAVGPRRLLVPIALLLAGCAYFNTFYYAKKYYTDAEAARVKSPEGKPNPQALDLYQKSMQKCAKVLTDHDGSRWVDDALLLMGKCALARGEYGTAIRTFEELREFYPKSDLAREARYHVAVARLEDGDVAIAAQTFGEVLEDPKARRHHPSAQYHLGLARLRLGDSTAAVSTFEEFLSAHAKDPWARKAAETIAEVELARGAPERARRAYEMIQADPTREWATYKVARLAVARSLRLEGRADEARQVLDALLTRTKVPADSAEIALERGVLARAEGNDSLAVALFSDVPTRFPRTPSAARALHERGLLLVDRFGDLAWAKLSFDSVTIHSTSGPEGKEAKPRADVLGQRLLLDERLAGRLQRIEAATAPVESSAIVGDSAWGWGAGIEQVADSIRGGDTTDVAAVTADSADVAAGAADGPDSAVATPDSVSAVVDSENATADSVEAAVLTPDSAAADSLPPALLTSAGYLAALGPEGRHALYVVADSASREEIAGALVEIGQVELLKLGRTAQALDAYETVIRDFSDSPYAPQALLSTAWIREHRLGEREEAEVLYRRLLDEHPESPYARGAAEALGVPYVEEGPAPLDTAVVRTALETELAAARQALTAARGAVEDAARSLAAAESAGAGAAEEIAPPPGAEEIEGGRAFRPIETPLQTDEDGFAGSPMDQLPPRLVELATPEYPPDLERRGIEGDVIVEVVLGPTGEVTDARVVQSGNFELENYALEAARRSRFTRPGMIDRTTVTFHFPPVLQTTEPDPNAPTALTQVTPEYPTELAQRGVVGSVRVQVTVGPTGDVVQAQVIQSENHELDRYAVDAARRMLFTPPRDVDHTVVTFRFPPEGG